MINDEKPLVTIIVPVYNAEAKLRKCVDSILQQRYKHYELLLVNDGSKDTSGSICDEYAKKESRVKVFHKENGGVSSARNFGLINATGSWICFIDSDDFIEEDYLESFSLNKDETTELMVSGYTIDNKVNNLEYKKEISFFDDYSFNNTVFRLNKEKFLSRIWGMLLDNNVIKSNKLQFNEKFRFGEDTLFLWSYLLNVNTICLIRSTGYHYIKYDSETLASIFNTYVSLTEVNEEIFKLKKSFERRIDNEILKKKFNEDIFNEYSLLWLRACISMYGRKYFLKSHKNRINNWIQFSQNARIDLLPESSPLMKITKYLLLQNRISLLDILYRLWGLLK